MSNLYTSLEQWRNQLLFNTFDESEDEYGVVADSEYYSGDDNISLPSSPLLLWCMGLISGISNISWWCNDKSQWFEMSIWNGD